MSTRPVPSDRDARDRFPALDGVRGAAALLVLVSHVGYESGRAFTGIFGGLLSRAEIGVTLFFVLSGFLLYHPFARSHLLGTPRPTVGRYLWRRALRILPAYWVVLTFVALTLHRDEVNARLLGVAATLTQIYRPGYLLDELGQTWTLATEVSWYLLLPVLALLLTRPRQRSASRQLTLELLVVLAMTVCSISYAFVARGTDLLDPFVSGFWLPHYVGWFAIGMAFAVLEVHLRQHPASSWGFLRDAGEAIGTCWALAAILYLLAGNAVAGPRVLVASSAWEGVVREGLYAVVAALVILPCIFGHQRRGRLRAALSGPVARYLANVSYAVFLWHFPLKTLTFEATDTAPFTGRFWLNLVVLVVVSLVVATGSWYLVEKPLLRFKDVSVSWRWRRHAGSAGSTSTNDTPTTASATATRT
jgi:peptidoglycan/LPS O-acetylase OafA/YrhL